MLAKPLILKIGFAISLLVGVTFPTSAGQFFFNGQVTFAANYLGVGQGAPVRVCLSPSTPVGLRDPASRGVSNAVSSWNRRRVTTANVRPNFNPQGTIDFESVMLHELGHCSGLGHSNLGSVVARPQANATAAGPGANAQFDTNPGPDGIHGTSDDIRGDDVNRFYFRIPGANPFSIPETVDSTTYTIAVSQLPPGEQFPANPERLVGPQYGVSLTESAMQHDIVTGEIARTLSHDDVATIRYAMSGVDATAGTSDDYQLMLDYQGMTTQNCDITVQFDNSTALASCNAGGFTDGSLGPGVFLSSGTIRANPGINWAFNEQSPCTSSVALPQNGWKQIALPCEVGISSGDSVRDVLADDLGESEYDSSWVIFRPEYVSNGSGVDALVTRKLTLDDTLESGVGYWIISTAAGASIDVTGEYHSQLDSELRVNGQTGSGWNMVGNPFRFNAVFADTQVIAAGGQALSLSQADPGGAAVSQTRCTQSGGPGSNCTAARFGFRFDANGNQYELLGDGADSLQPFDAFWVFAGAESVEWRVQMPVAERNTP